MIMAKDKTIKTATLKKRFEKLHHAANYAEECAKAIEWRMLLGPGLVSLQEWEQKYKK